MILIEKLSHALGSRTLAGALVAVIGLGVLAGVFELGEFVGFHKASFASRWEENYEHNFGGLPQGMATFNRRIPNPHGAAGKIVSVTAPTFSIVGDFENEKTIRVASSTIIRKGDQEVTFKELVVGESAVVIGTPNEQGEIDATLIRILPTLPAP
jgi:hypothetical protein